MKKHRLYINILPEKGKYIWRKKRNDCFFSTKVLIWTQYIFTNLYIWGIFSVHQPIFPVNIHQSPTRWVFSIYQPVFPVNIHLSPACIPCEYSPITNLYSWWIFTYHQPVSMMEIWEKACDCLEGNMPRNLGITFFYKL